MSMIEKDVLNALAKKRQTMCDLRGATGHGNDSLSPALVRLRKRGLVRIAKRVMVGKHSLAVYEITHVGRIALREQLGEVPLVTPGPYARGYNWQAGW
jgi:DNA-binding PadR family transcriptional regulator